MDLPGIHDLSGSREDEAVGQRFLRHTPPDLILLVLNASQITSQLPLLLQLRTLGVPMMAALNMSDEAQRLGLAIDHQGLTDVLGQAHRLGERLRAVEGPGAPEVLVDLGEPDELEALRRELVARFVRQPEGVLNCRLLCAAERS